MRFVVSRSGIEADPVDIEVLDEMIANGDVQSADQVRPENSDAWVSIGQFVEMRKYAVPRLKPVTSGLPPDVPPPLPTDFPAHNLDRPVPRVGDKAIKGTENMTVRELTEQIRNGARITIFGFCVSIILITFRRPSPITLIPAGKSGFGLAFLYSAISLVLGWWGIPWGPIYTIASLVTNAKGGNDITEPLLVDLVGAEEAEKIMAGRIQPKRLGGLKAVGVAVVAFALAIFAAFSGMTAIDAAEEADVSGHGAEAFIGANETLRHSEAPGAGNTQEARVIAAATSRFINTTHNEFFKGSALFKSNVRSHAEIHGQTCAVIVYVPEISNYKGGETRESLGHFAWLAAQTAIGKNPSPAQPIESLAVGVRSFGGYDRVLIGHPAVAEEEFESTIESTQTGSDSRDALVPFFAEAE